MTRKRARTGTGKFRGDDPSTPDVNEAWEEPAVAKDTPVKKKAAKKTTAKKTAAANTPMKGSALYKQMVLRGEIKE